MISSARRGYYISMGPFVNIKKDLKRFRPAGKIKTLISKEAHFSTMAFLP
jgi:hypothetical protein